MKGYCPKCGKEVDEVEYAQFKGSCINCVDILKTKEYFGAEFSDLDTSSQDNLIEAICIRILKIESKIFHLEEES